MLMNVHPLLPSIDKVVSVLETQGNAIRMLQARIDTIKEYLVDVQEGISFERRLI